MEAILKYLIDNKEWIFSGLGIFIIGGIISLIKFIINRNKKASKKTNLDHKVRKSLYKTITMEWTTKTPNHYAKI